MSVSAHKIKVEDQQKRSSARNLTLRFGVHEWFSSWNGTLLKLGGTQEVFWGARAAKCTPVASGPLLSFGLNSRFVGHISRLWGTSSDMGGTAPKCSP